MRVEGNTVVLERKDCSNCKYSGHPGTEASEKYKTCEKCKGRGRRGNGNCRNCHGSGTVRYFDHDDRITCHVCKGEYKDFNPENWTDDVDVSFLPVEVLRTERVQDWVESHIGAGVYTIIDYGRHKQLSDEEIIAPVRKELKSVQACKVVNNKEEMRLCNKIVIITASGGYSAIPYWEGGRDGSQGN